MTLYDIENIVRKNCIVVNDNSYILKTNEKFEISQDVGQIIFTAIAHKFGFTAHKIIEHLVIDQKREYSLLAEYKKADELYGQLSIKELYDNQDKYKKVLSKVRLILKGLHAVKKQEYVSVESFGY